MLSESLQAIITQTLCKKVGGGRVAALEILIGTSAVRNLIREGKSHQLLSVIQTGAKFGMQTLDSHLLSLYVAGRISYDELITKSRDVDTQLEKIKELLAAQKG